MELNASSTNKLHLGRGRKGILANFEICNAAFWNEQARNDVRLLLNTNR
jgi:hypothetical protein